MIVTATKKERLSNLPQGYLECEKEVCELFEDANSKNPDVYHMYVNIAFTSDKMQEFRQMIKTKAKVRYLNPEKKYRIALKITEELGLKGKVKKFNISLKEFEDIYYISFFMYYTESDSEYIHNLIEEYANMPIFL